MTASPLPQRQGRFLYDLYDLQPVAAVRGQEGLQLRPEGGIILPRHHAQGRSGEAAAVYHVDVSF